MTQPILSIRDLTVSFPGARDTRVTVVDDVTFDVGRGESVALVGESGSGKSVTALTAMALGAPASRVDRGSVLVGGADLIAMDEPQRSAVRGHELAMIFQSPRTSLNPLLRAGDQIARVVRRREGLGARESRRRAVELMTAVGIDDPDRRYGAFPHQLSGGMAQRVMIALALAVKPALLIADEPTTALDVTIQRQIFDLLLDLRDEFGIALLLITHDLAVVAETSERVVVMAGGRVVECGSTKAILTEAVHPYTQRLVGSILRADRRVRLQRWTGDESVPAPGSSTELHPVDGSLGHWVLPSPDAGART